MPMKELLLTLSLTAALLVVALGFVASAPSSLEQCFAGAWRTPPATFLWTRVGLLMISASLLVVALG
ncbi:MAG: hypothetical protein ACREU3_20045 [Steroidobacteraceae bacterium]